MSTSPEPRLPQAPSAGPQPAAGPQPEGEQAITQPAKLLRIATMVRELLEDTRQASLDEPGRIRLRQIYERAIGELEDVLSPDLQEELATLAPPIQGIPTDAEIRVAQAQLVGWLEGLFHGIQAALFSQQMAARAQFEELRRRGLPSAEPPVAPEGGRGPYL
jgi:proteasome activator-like protein